MCRETMPELPVSVLSACACAGGRVQPLKRHMQTFSEPEQAADAHDSLALCASSWQIERQFTKNKNDRDLFAEMTIIIDTRLIAQPVCGSTDRGTDSFTAPPLFVYYNMGQTLLALQSVPCNCSVEWQTEVPFPLFPRHTLIAKTPYIQHPLLHTRTQGRGRLKDSIQELRVNVEVREQPLPHTITWQRTSSDCDFELLRESGSIRGEDLPAGVITSQVSTSSAALIC